MVAKKILTWGGIALIGAMVLTSCGSDSASQNESTATPATVEEKKAQVTDAVKNATLLTEAFQNDFSVGAAINMGVINNEEQLEHITENYNSITMGNEMKPESLLDWQATAESEDGMPEIKTENLDKILKTAQEKNIPVRGHCLVWHSQTPSWFFSKDYEPSNGLADKEEMRQRMEVYIKKVLTYCQENYPGVVYAWDVVNEGMSDDGGYRMDDSSWYATYGDESYIIDAFTFARKYADKDVKLFYNDYNEYTVMKRDLIVELLKELREKGLVDGMGMQSHWDMEYPGVSMVTDALEVYGQIEGLEIHLTEIDMHNTDNSEEGLKKQAERYKMFFESILRADRTGVANITNVTFWGMTDEDSWLSGFKGETSYPLLFDAEFEKKPCYDSILKTAKQEY